MKVFFLKKENFTPYDKRFLFGNSFKTEKRNVEFALSRFLLDFVLKNVYNIKNYEIETINKKPKIKNSNVKFSISHSKEVVLVAFSNFEIGADVELIKEIKLDRYSKYFKKNFESLNNFYDFWTKYEAEIKLQTKANFFKSLIIENEYYLSLCAKEKIKKVEFYKLIKNNNSIAIEELKIEN